MAKRKAGDSTMNPTTQWPALMAYIASRNLIECSRDWCSKLHEDEAEAERGGFADVAAGLAAAHHAYKIQQEALGRNGFPYNSAMGEFLGLGLRSNGEPGHGYYMANCVMHHYRAGVARRAVEAMIAEGRELSIVVGRSKKDRKPVRFARFRGDQIKIAHGGVVVSDGKRTIRLSSNWSTETCLEAVAAAMRAGVAYGEHP